MRDENMPGSEAGRYIYGPVPSRRLGLSLGVDIVPPKICTLDCVYCQIGRTTEKSSERQDFVPIEAVLAELGQKLREGIQADYVTIGGSGEPTLHSRLGELIDGVRRLTDMRVVILTNGTLLFREDVRADCAKADVVVPSLDAGDAAMFKRINRPVGDISIEKLVSGLVQFRREFTGQIWLEVFLMEGVNTSAEDVAKIGACVTRIKPDKVQLNTAVRPTADQGIQPATIEALTAAAQQIGVECQIIGAAPPPSDRHSSRTGADVLSMLKRRPCSVTDVATGLGITMDDALEHLGRLEVDGVLIREQRGDITYYRSRSQQGR